jgi:RNA polymerase sigma-70 factor (ECF subfamily)
MELELAVRRAQSGDVDAFEHVVHATATSVRAYLALYVRDVHTIDDLAQETFLTAFRQLHKFKAGTNLTAWMKQIARFTALRSLRAKQRRSAAFERYVSAIQVTLAEEAEAQSQGEARETLERLRECIRRLTERMQALMAWRYEEARPITEIARRTGESYGSIAVALHRARRTLADCLEEGGV